ncbi:amidohydrolase family protein [Candidatus Gracilibacteria bacterium]|nr:amidohydrolase family protein [Candidatus Gracilibacteria bacterium]
MKYSIQNVQVINHDESFIGNILVGGGKILKVSKSPTSKQKDTRKRDYLISPSKGEVSVKEIDGTGKLLMPGIIDPHVHFRDPGLTDKEDFTSGSKAAICGGVTSVFDMPNTVPPTFTVEALKQKRAIVQSKSLVNWGLYFGGGDNIDEIKKVKNIPGVKLYVNSTTGNLKNIDKDIWRQIFHATQKVSLHAEGEAFAEVVKVWKEEKYPCELHLCHTSLKLEINLLRSLKKDTLTSSLISAEVCPHYLLLTSEDLARYPLATMKPPLATKEDQGALWEGIQDGTIDILATDHAPHLISEKEKLPPSYGIPGVETLFPLMFTEFVKRGISLSKFVEMTSWRTREIFHIQNSKGYIFDGFDADMILVDPHKKWKIDSNIFYSKAHWSPFEDWNVEGQIEKVWLGGELICEEGRISNKETRGKEIFFESAG